MIKRKVLPVALAGPMWCEQKGLQYVSSVLEESIWVKFMEINALPQALIASFPKGSSGWTHVSSSQLQAS